MRINISYHESLSFEQFKEQFEKHFALSNPVKKEAEMKKAHEKAEGLIKAKPAPEVQTSKELNPTEQSEVKIRAEVPMLEGGVVAQGIEASDKPAYRPVKNK